MMEENEEEKVRPTTLSAIMMIMVIISFVLVMEIFLAKLSQE
jgi:hypothetical protein